MKLVPDRDTLLEYYAKVLLTETAYVPAKEEQQEGGEAGGSDGEEEAEFAESDASVSNTAGGQKSAEAGCIANEESLLLLEMKKLDEQRLQRELEERRWQQQQEQQRMQIELQRMQLEQQRVLEEKRLEVQKMQLEHQNEENVGRESFRR